MTTEMLLLYTVIGLQVILLLMWWNTNTRLGRLESRLEMRIQPVEVPVVSMPVPAAQPGQSGDMSQVQAMIMSGRKIEAIKLYREMTDVGLKEAKDAVEVLERQMKGYQV